MALRAAGLFIYTVICTALYGRLFLLCRVLDLEQQGGGEAVSALGTTTMSFNFTGSTGKRNINLGNRSLAGKNKDAFLKAAQLERLKREAMRARTDAAVVLQSAWRRAYDMESWRKSLEDNWDGRSIVEFKYFFPHLMNNQPYQKSIDLLAKIDENFDNYTTNELKTLIPILTRCFLNLNFSQTGKEKQIVLLLYIIRLIVKAMKRTPFIFANPKEAFSFTRRLVTLYLKEGVVEVLYYIFELSQSLLLRDGLVMLLENESTDYITDAISNGWSKELASFQMELFSRLLSTSEFNCPITTFLGLEVLYTISYTMQNHREIHQNMDNFYTVVIPLVTRVMMACAHELEYDEETGKGYLHAFDLTGVILYGELFDAVKVFYKSEDIESYCRERANPDITIAYVAALLKYSTHFTHNQPNKLKNWVDLNWILKERNSGLIKACFNIILSYKDFINSDTIPNEKLLLFVRIDCNRRWFDAFSIFSEFLMNMIALSSDENFYSGIIISRQELIDFMRFSNLFIKEILLKYRDLSKDLDHSCVSQFSVVFSKLLSLNHALYMKNLKIDIVKENNFWVLSNFDLEFSSIASVIPAVDRLHTELPPRKQVFDDDSSNFLLKSKLVDFCEPPLPKKIVDSLYVLTYAPYMIPFEKRAEIFHYLIEYDKQKNDINGWYPTKVEGVVARDNILFDSYKHFGGLSGKNFKLPFSVQFVNQFGELEAGIDGGGLTKELLTALVSSVFIPSEENRTLNRGLQFFRQGTNYKLYCSPELFFKHEYEFQHPEEEVQYPVSESEYLEIVKFLGMILGKCLYDNVLLDVSFTSIFLIFWSSIGSKKFRNFMGDHVDDISYNSNSFDELRSIDESLYQSLNYVMKQTDPTKFEQMGLEFVVDDYFYDKNLQKRHVTVPLLPYRKPDADTPPAPVQVSPENKMQFVRLMTLFKLSKQSDRVMKAFVEGLFMVIKPYWLLLFNPYELQTLISGDDDDIDIGDLQANVQYGGGYMGHDQTIVDLFQILREFDNETRGKFIKFVTSSSKQPLLGFKELNPKFGINKAGPDLNRLPTASTCVNLLKLPDYKNKELLKKKLLYSINSKAGFDLS